MTREEAIEAIKCNWPDSRYTILREALDMAISALREQDTADVAPVRHARWKRYGKNLGECSVCGEIVSVRSNYCPNCGAKMDGGANNEAD